MAEIRFYLDENVANAVANGLRHRGIDVLITTEAGHEGWDDPQQLRFARVEGRVLVTQDDDLLRLVHEGADHAGIVYYKTQTRSIKQISRGLLLIFEVLSPDDMRNHVEFL